MANGVAHYVANFESPTQVHTRVRAEFIRVNENPDMVGLNLCPLMTHDACAVRGVSSYGEGFRRQERESL